MEGKELAFFGKIAAGVTHELKNVLAIINESNGLMSDLLAMAMEAPFPHRERFLRSISKIDDQVRRGVDITTRFNQFAHSMDNAVVSADLNEIVERTVALAQRFARLKNVELKAAGSGAPIFAVTSPFRLQMALTKAVEVCIAALSGPGTIVLETSNAPSPSVCIGYEGKDGSRPNFRELICAFSAWQDFLAVADVMDGSVQWRQDGAGFSLLLGGGLEKESTAQAAR